MITAPTRNSFSKKLAMIAATLMLALGISTTTVTTAQAGRDGRIIAGAIAGAALLAIIAGERRHKHRGRRHHDRYHIHYDEYGDPYRCSRRHRGGHRRHWRRDHW